MISLTDATPLDVYNAIRDEWPEDCEPWIELDAETRMRFERAIGPLLKAWQEEAENNACAW